MSSINNGAGLAAVGNIAETTKSNNSNSQSADKSNNEKNGEATTDESGGRPKLMKRKSSRLSKQSAEVIEDDAPAAATSVVTESNTSTSTPTKMRIPETRVESFEEWSTGGSLVATTNTSSEADDSAAAMKSNKMLVRSHALCGDDDTKLNPRGIDKQSSSKTGSACSSLSRDSSNEMYTDATGINLEEFIVSTLHKNQKDRQMLLQLEDEMRRFVNEEGLDSKKQYYKFPPMSSYNRMLVHRVAAFFGLDHNVDQSGQAIVVTKSRDTRLPEVEFKQYIQSDHFTDDAKRLLRRDVQSYEEGGMNFLTVMRGAAIPPDGCAAVTGVLGPQHAIAAHSHLLDHRKTRSFDDRDDSFDRPRFYNQGSSSSQEIMESPLSESVMNAAAVAAGGMQPGMYITPGPTALSTTDGSSGGGSVAAAATMMMSARPWSSTDSHSSALDVPLQQPAPPTAHLPVRATSAGGASMQKAGSFGGVPTVYRQTPVVDPASVSPVRPPSVTSRTSQQRCGSGCGSDSSVGAPGGIAAQQRILAESASGAAATYLPAAALYGGRVICAVPPNEVPLNAIILQPRPISATGVPMAFGAGGYVPVSGFNPAAYNSAVYAAQQQQPQLPGSSDNLAVSMQQLNMQQVAGQPSDAPFGSTSMASPFYYVPASSATADAQHSATGAIPPYAPGYVASPVYSHATTGDTPVTQMTYMAQSTPTVYAQSTSLVGDPNATPTQPEPSQPPSETG